MQRTQERLDSYAYPVLTLPNETVSEIFVRFLPVYPLCPPQTGLLSPTVLTHICRKWREIALATPALWRAISIVDDIDSDRTDGRQLHILESWLNRSGCLPLAVDKGDWSASISAECLEKLVLHSARWEYITLGIKTLSHLLAIPNTMPQLQHLDLRLYDHGSPPPVAYHDVPRLRSATLWDFDYPPELLPWTQLTSLTLVCKLPTECTAVLQHTVNLVHCELVTADDLVRPPDVKLERLESLVLMPYAEEQDPATHYLDTLIVPTLRTLTVPEDFLQPDPINMLTVFISKSGCQLENVCIIGERFVPKHRYREAFSSIPKLSFERSPACYLDLHN
ncbi:hypothetical protein FB451DRAFT_1307044 [Mycena latifolia]|nr:hypothetical protein FB451DRAFT_1307044 [Mycena latifolia]